MGALHKVCSRCGINKPLNKIIKDIYGLDIKELFKVN